MKKLFFILICILALSGCSNEEAQKAQETANEVSPGTTEEASSNDTEEAPLLEIVISESAAAAMNAELSKHENQGKIYMVVYNHAGNG